MAIIDILLTIAIDKSNLTWYDVLVQDRRRPAVANEHFEKEVNEMKILVVDDSPRNQQAAREQLVGHNLTIVSDYDDAERVLTDSVLKGGLPFDVVLTDMELPESNTRGMIPGAGPLGTEVVRDSSAINPLGFPIALLAVGCDVKKVAMVTSTFHHHGAMAGAVHDLRECMYEINGARVLFLADSLTNLRGEAPTTLDKYVKNWGMVLGRLIA